MNAALNGLGSQLFGWLVRLLSFGLLADMPGDRRWLRDGPSYMWDLTNNTLTGNILLPPCKKGGAYG